MTIGNTSQTLSNLNITGIVTPAGVAQVAPGAAVGVAASNNVSDIINLIGFNNFSIGLNIDVNTPAAGVFTAAITDILTKTAHGLYTGAKVQFTTTTTLPAGLSLATDYFVIRLDANTFKVADTLAHAIAGTNIIDITDTGTGTHTVTATALAGAGYTLQGSNDQIDWFTEVAQVSITVDALAAVAETTHIAVFKYYRLYYAITAGMMSIVGNVSKNT